MGNLQKKEKEKRRGKNGEQVSKEVLTCRPLSKTYKTSRRKKRGRTGFVGSIGAKPFRGGRVDAPIGRLDRAPGSF